MGKSWRLPARLPRLQEVWRGIALIMAAVVVGVVMAEIVATITGMAGPVSVLLFFLLYAAAVYAVARLWLRYWHRRRFRLAGFNALLDLTPHEFEAAIAALLHDLGYRRVEVRGAAGDLAADITCRDPLGRLVLVQCKRYAPGIRVGSGEVQSFVGRMAVQHRAEQGIFVTTSGFTRPAADLGREHGVELVDGERLRHIVTDMQHDAPDLVMARACSGACAGGRDHE